MTRGALSRRAHSSPSLAMPSSSEAASAASASVVPEPTSRQLRILAIRRAIPMVGFGFMDNVVMITAGEAIDMSIGVSFGLSTLTAAGLGQCCSDVAGITSGGLVDAAVTKLRLPHHHLTEAQLELKASRVYTAFGQCVGVVTGCLLGMSVLLFMDTNAVERAKQARELNTIFESVVDSGHNLVQAERATLWMVDGDELWSQVTVGTKEHVRVPKDSGVVGAAIKSGKTIVHLDASEDEKFDQAVDEKFGYVTKTMLTVPVKTEDGKVIGAIQMHNKMNDDGTEGVFTIHDEKMVELLASHVATFIRVVHGSD